jgi:hypothetical protein
MIPNSRGRLNSRNRDDLRGVYAKPRGSHGRGRSFFMAGAGKLTAMNGAQTLIAEACSGVARPAGAGHRSGFCAGVGAPQAARVGRLSRCELRSRASEQPCACGACGGLKPSPFPCSCSPGAASGFYATHSGPGLPPGSGEGFPRREFQGRCRRGRRLLCSGQKRNPQDRS